MSSELRSTPPPGGWRQGTLIPPEVVTLKLTIGIVNSVGHLQWQVEALEGAEGTQLALISRPHAALAAMPAEFSAALLALLTVAQEVAGPF